MHNVARTARFLRKTLTKLNIQEWVGEQAEIHVEVVRHVCAVVPWLEALKVTPHGGLLLDQTGVHCFVFMRRKGPHMRHAEHTFE